MGEDIQNAYERIAALRKVRYAYSKWKEAVISELNQTYIDSNGNPVCRSKEARKANVIAEKRYASAYQNFMEIKIKKDEKEGLPEK